MNKEIEELLKELKYFDRAYVLKADEIKELLSYIVQLENNRDKAIYYTDVTIKLIEQQPTEDDTWILDRLKGFKNILKGDSDYD